MHPFLPSSKNLCAALASKRTLPLLASLVSLSSIIPAGGSVLPTHPGAFVTQADLDTLRSRLDSGLDPWSSAFDAMINDGANTTYQPSVSAVVTDSYAIQNQGNAAWVLAVKWAATGNINYAIASRRVIDAWVSTVTDMTACTTLRTGVGGCQMAQAAEILASGFNGASGWPAANIAAARAWFKNVPYGQVLCGTPSRSANWGTSALAGCMAMAIFCDDQAMFDYAVEAYKHGFTDTGDGFAGVTQYIDASGQDAETGRDQGHSQGGIAHLMEVARMAWNQGINLVTYNNTDWGTVDIFGDSYGATGANRVFIGHEYTAKYNLGFTVSYHPFLFGTNQVYYPDGPSTDWGGVNGSPVWEMAARLFTDAGLTPTFTQQILGNPGYAPEGSNGDHCGFGTLLYRNTAGVPRKTTDDDSYLVTYGGTVGTSTLSGLFDGSEHDLNATGAFAQATFNGTSIQWITRKAFDRGMADVYIDGVLSASSVDCYSPTTVNQFVGFGAYGLANTPHTIKIVRTANRNPASSGNYISIDAFNALPVATVPARPASLTATNSTGAPYTQVSLAWAAAAGATSYTVKRAVASSGPYTTIASGLGGTSYSDTAVALQTPYYYVVSAVNAAGESMNSFEASAIPGLIDDAAASIAYGGTWSAVATNSDWRRNEHQSNTNGSYAQWNFTGTNVQVLARVKFDSGMMNVFIDGVLRAVNVDGYNPNQRFQRVVYGVSGLTNAPHTIKIALSGTHNPASTNFFVALDAFAVGIPLVNRARNAGATAAASGQNAPNETAAKAFDGSVTTKWSNGSPLSPTGSLQVQFGSGQDAWVAREYRLTSANDVPQRDPKDWQLQGSNDGSTWVNLDTRTGQVFASRYQTNIYPLANEAPYRLYRLNITANSGGSAYGLQLAEFAVMAY